MRKNYGIIIFIGVIFILFSVQAVNADIPSIGKEYRYDHPKENAIYAYLSLFALISIVIAFSLIVLSTIRRNKKSQNNLPSQNVQQK